MHIDIIKNEHHEQLPFAQSLYESTFAWHERRNWQQLLALLGEPDMNFGVILKQAMPGEPVGFVIWWEFGEWLYVEHMAIEPDVRGEGYGKQVITYLAHLSGNKLVLEVDLPNSINAERRIGFYEGLGLVVCPITYIQPPYRKGEAPTPMSLMSMPSITDKTIFNKLTALIKEQVYERFY